MLAQITGLIDRGVDVRIFADSRGPNAELTDASSDLRSRVKYFGLPLKTIRESVGRVLMHNPANALVSTSNSLAGASPLRLRFERRAFERQKAFDIVHAHFGPNGVRATRLRENGVFSAPIVTSFYGYDITREWSRGGYSDLFARGDRFIALSNIMRDQLIQLGAPESGVVVHRLGVDLTRFTRAQRASDRVHIISVARLAEKKGIEYGIGAAAALIKRNVKVRYTIVGDGPRHSSLRELASRYGISDHVEFTGAASRGRIAQLLSESDILLAPSVTAVDGDTEGTPVAILEAMASYLPVVSTIHSAIPEIVHEGVSGFLVAERDEEALAERVMRLVDDSSLRTRMGEAGRAFVEENHDIATLNDAMHKLYSQVAGSRGKVN